LSGKNNSDTFISALLRFIQPWQLRGFANRLRRRKILRVIQTTDGHVELVRAIRIRESQVRAAVRTEAARAIFRKPQDLGWRRAVAPAHRAMTVPNAIVAIFNGVACLRAETPTLDHVEISTAPKGQDKLRIAIPKSDGQAWIPQLT
jgi:hypothetical protein